MKIYIYYIILILLLFNLYLKKNDRILLYYSGNSFAIIVKNII